MSQLKVVSNIKVQNYKASDVMTSGVVTEDKKFVISAMCRQGSPKWSPSKNNTDIEVNILNRVDISIALWDEKEQKQGDYIIPYLSHRIMQTRQLNGGNGMLFEANPFDNENTRTTFKNALLSKSIWDAMKKAISVAAITFASKIEAGESLNSPSSQLEFGADLVKAALTIQTRNASKTTPAAEEPTTNVAQSAADALDQE